MKRDTIKEHVYNLLRAYSIKFPQVGINWYHADELSEQLLNMLKQKRVLRTK